MWVAVIGTLLGALLGYFASVRVADRSHRQSLERDERSRHYDSSIAEFREMRVVATQFRAEWTYFATHLQQNILRQEPDLAGLHAKSDLICIMAPELRDIVGRMMTKDVYTNAEQTDEVYREFEKTLVKVLQRMWPENLDEKS